MKQHVTTRFELTPKDKTSCTVIKVVDEKGNTSYKVGINTPINNNCCDTPLDDLEKIVVELSEYIEKVKRLC